MATQSEKRRASKLPEEIGSAHIAAQLAAGEISSGPVFRPVLKGGRVQPVALTDRSVAAIVKAYAERTGLGEAGAPGADPGWAVAGRF